MTRTRRRRARVPTILAILIVVVCLGAAAIGLYVRTINTNLKRLADSPISVVDLSRVPDGTYSGECRVLPIIARVEVTVVDHRITQIQLVEHRHGRGAAAEVIPSRVVEAQTLNVDTVSGATFSSKAILKAMEDALTSASGKS